MTAKPVTSPTASTRADTASELVQSGPDPSSGPDEPTRRRPPWPGRTRLRLWGTDLAAFLVVLFVWWALTGSKMIQPLFLPSPQSVVRAFIEANSCRPIAAGNPRVVCGEQGYFLWEHLLASLQRIGIGVLAGIAVGVLLGFAMALVPVLGRLVEPYLSFLRSLPPLGYIGLLIVWFGIGDTSKIWLLFLAAFPPIALATIDGVKGIRSDRVHAAQSLGASRMQVLRFVILPASLPSIMSGVRLATGFAWTTVVAAELNNGIPGIGGLAYLSGTQLQTPLTIACIIVIGIAAILLDALIKRITSLLVPWQGRA